MGSEAEGVGKEGVGIEDLSPLPSIPSLVGPYGVSDGRGWGEPKSPGNTPDGLLGPDREEWVGGEPGRKGEENTTLALIGDGFLFS